MFNIHVYYAGNSSPMLYLWFLLMIWMSTYVKSVGITIIKNSRTHKWLRRHIKAFLGHLNSLVINQGLLRLNWCNNVMAGEKRQMNDSVLNYKCYWDKVLMKQKKSDFLWWGSIVRLWNLLSWITHSPLICWWLTS